MGANIGKVFFGTNVVYGQAGGGITPPIPLFVTESLVAYFDTSNTTTFANGEQEIRSIDTYSGTTNITGSFNGTLGSGSEGGNTYITLSGSGASNYIDLNGYSLFTNNRDSGSVEMWVSASDYQTSTSNKARALINTQDGRDKGLYYGYWAGTPAIGGQQAYSGLFDSITFYPAASGSNAPAGWHQVVYTWDLVAGNHYIYIDGVQKDSFSYTNTGGGIADTVWIGGSPGGSGTAIYTEVSEFGWMVLRIYDDVLTSDEVLTNYNYDKSKVGL